MMTTLIRRLRREEEGYALVIAILLLSVMMVLLVVALTAGNSALQGATDGIRWAKTLTVAEAGVNDAITRLGASRSAGNPCDMAGATVCSAEDGGEYQVGWETEADGAIQITSRGYFPSKANAKYSREVQVTYEPVPTFRYAIYAQDALQIKNNPMIVGDVYSTNAVTVDNNNIVCGSITSANGSVTLGNNAQVLKTYAPYNCTGQTGNVWTGGSGGIVGNLGVVIAGYAKASNPTSVSANCKGNFTSYQITGGGTVQGNGTACGKITGPTVLGTSAPGTASTQPAVQTMPQFVFDPSNYTALTCYPSAGTCGANTSSTAVADFNTYVAAHKTNLSGAFAIWQTNPTQSTKINLDNLTNIAGDVTIATNAPIDFGNTNTITTTAGSADMAVISLYVPPSGTTCDTNGGDCSIYGQNAIQFSTGSPTDPNDGVVGLLYTTGKMSFKNSPPGNPWEGALYANSMDIKNGFDIVYNARVEQILGFGGAFEQTLWQEINV
jgi:hypothetical protein